MKLSVIVCVYNAEKYLRKCLKSITFQSFTDFEIIIVYDKSEDRSLEICNEFKASDSRFKIIENAGKRTLGRARNIGLKAAEGQWITFVDADDWIELDYYQNMFLYINNTDADIIISGGFIDESTKGQTVIESFGNAVFIGSEIETLVECSIRGGIANKGYTYCTHWIWSQFYSRDFIIKNNISFNEIVNQSEDILFSISTMNYATKVECCNIIGYHYRRNSCSGTNRFHENLKTELLCFLGYLHQMVISIPSHYKYINVLNYATFRVFSRIARQYIFHKDNHASYAERKKEYLDLKNQVIFKDVLQNEDSSYLTKKNIIIKAIYKSPFVLPLEIYFRYVRPHSRGIIR